MFQAREHREYLFHRIAFVGHGFEYVGFEDADQALHGIGIKRLLAVEVPVERGLGHPGLVGQTGHRHAVVAKAPECTKCRIADALAGLPRVGVYRSCHALSSPTN